jgi:hypothetical protein
MFRISQLLGGYRKQFMSKRKIKIASSAHKRYNIYRSLVFTKQDLYFRYIKNERLHNILVYLKPLRLQYQ